MFLGLARNPADGPDVGLPGPDVGLPGPDVGLLGLHQSPSVGLVLVGVIN